MKKGLVFMGMGFELVGLMLGSLYIGQIVDKTYDLGGMGVAVMSLLALVGWLYHLIILLKQFMKDSDKES